jgi:hypothetical protein
MRKVKFKRWIPTEWKDVSCGYLNKVVEGTGCFEGDYNHDGIFHQWANAYIETDNGVGNYTFGIIELTDGTIEEVLPKNIKFIET